MLFLRRPTDETITATLAEQGDLPFTYAEVGATRGKAPAGYPLNHHRGKLGRGRPTYDRACAALDAWAMYDISWTTVYPAVPPVMAGTVIGVLVRQFGFWTLNCARVVYVLRENGAVDRYGFAIGTLPKHSESGEERFTIEFQHGDESVWYEIYTFAGAGNLMIRLAFPLMRFVQRRFGRDSVGAMQLAVQRTGEEAAD